MMESASGVDVHRDWFCGWENPGGTLLWVCITGLHSSAAQACRSFAANEQRQEHTIRDNENDT